MSLRLPDFIIIGAMKCGTSTLHDQLSARSGLFLSDPKEPNFFSDEAAYARGMAPYTALFAGARPEQLCGESSTHYTKLPTYPHTVRNLLAHVPNAKLVYVVRDPIDRIVSQYIHEWTQTEVTGELDQAVLAHERFAAYSSYARQLEPFLAHFGAERVLPVCFERMVSHPDEVLAQVSKFIGDPSPEPLAWDPNRKEQNVSRDRMRKSALRDRVLDIGVVQTVKGLLPQTLRDRVKAYWQMRRRPELSAGVRAELEARLDPDLARLGRWLGLELACKRWEAASTGLLAWRDPPGAHASAGSASSGIAT